jgi:hypothetical protein
MILCHREPTLDDILSDSIIRAMMKADGVDPVNLAKTLRQMAHRPSRAQSADPPASD